MSREMRNYLNVKHEDDPDAIDAAIAERDRWLEVKPLDMDGTRIFLGAMVRYGPEGRAYPWTPKRWGIATGLVVTPRIGEPGDDLSIVVQEVGASADKWFSCDPARLVVLNTEVTP